MGELYQVKHYEQGVTLIELLVGVALLALVLALGVPTFSETTQRKHLEGAAEKMFSDFQFAKAESIKRNAQIFVTFNIANQCYGLNTSAGCSCNTANSCSLDGVDKSVKMIDYGATIIPAGGVTFGGSEVAFDPRRGTATKNGTVTFQSPRGQQARVMIESAYHIRICSPAGSAKVFTYEDC